MSLTDQIIQAESSGNPNATNPNSSAAGAGQFLAPTWLAVVKQHRPDLAQGRSDDEILSMRADPKLSAEMTGAYAADNQAILSKNGVPVTPGSTYLAHFAGPQGAVKVLQADPNAPIETVLSPAAIKANPFLKGMTAQGLQAWAAKRVGAQSPIAAPQAAPQPQAPQQTPQQPPEPAQAPKPIFAGGPAPAPAFTDAPIQAPPIFAAQRKPIDLSGLRAQLARAPIFANQG